MERSIKTTGSCISSNSALTSRRIGCNKLSTPENKYSSQGQLENEYSPGYLPSTQEAFNDLDVMWDWNSPNSSKKKTVKKKMKQNLHSPKITIKKHPSNNQIQTFDKLKSELEALKKQFVCESAEKSSVKSLAFCESLFYDDGLKNKGEPNDFCDFEDLFNDDSLDQQLLLCSQKVEDNILRKCNIQDEVTVIKSNLHKLKSENYINSSNDKILSYKSIGFSTTKSNYELSSVPQYNITNGNANHLNNDSGNDSFDMAMANFKEDDVISTENMNTQFTVNRSDKLQHDETGYVNGGICNFQEIERKKMEALKKLQAKKHQCTKSPCSSEFNAKDTQNADESTTLKCSPEEIEQKRLRALAKLEAKKNFEIIEKNRREALKKLEMNKKKRALDSQRSLISRTVSR